MLRFTIYGKLIGVDRSGNHWNAYRIGTEGKYRDADFIIPDEVTEEEINGYLADLFHESAAFEKHGPEDAS